MLTTQIKDGRGTSNRLHIDEEGAVHVVVHQHPPLDDDFAPIPFRQFFTDTGLSGGASDMRVIGTPAAPKIFLICARQDVDVYIKTISIEITDANATLSQFGNIGVLANGVQFFWTTGDKGNVVIAEALTTNWEFVRLAGGNPPFAENSAGAAFRASNVSGGSEGYIPVIDTQKVFGLNYGLRLRKNTNDCLAFAVRDNLTGVDSFNIIGLGIQL